VGCGADPRDHLSPAERRFWDQLGTRYLCVYPMFSRPWEQDTPRAAPPGLVEVEDVSGRLLGWFRRHGGFRALGRNTVAVIRPDRYVFGLCRPERLGAVTGEAAQQFGIALAEASPADRRATTEALGGAGA
jgi:3-(3-hydroxy-phenyl)propionate hydroxylase